MGQAVKDLLDNKCIVETPFKPRVVSPVSVFIKKVGNKRLILDLGIVNKDIWKEKISLETGFRLF